MTKIFPIQIITTLTPDRDLGCEEQIAAWAQAKMKWPRRPQMPTFDTQAGHRRQWGPQGVHQSRGEGHGQGRKMKAKKVNAQNCLKHKILR